MSTKRGKDCIFATNLCSISSIANFNDGRIIVNCMNWSVGFHHSRGARSRRRTFSGGNALDLEKVEVNVQWQPDFALFSKRRIRWRHSSRHSITSDFCVTVMPSWPSSSFSEPKIRYALWNENQGKMWSSFAILRPISWYQGDLDPLALKMCLTYCTTKSCPNL